MWWRKLIGVLMTDEDKQKALDRYEKLVGKLISFSKNESTDTHYNLHVHSLSGLEGFGIVEKIGSKLWEATNAHNSCQDSTRLGAAKKLLKLTWHKSLITSQR